jgi:hypothetical protein
VITNFFFLCFVAPPSPMEGSRVKRRTKSSTKTSRKKHSHEVHGDNRDHSVQQLASAWDNAVSATQTLSSKKKLSVETQLAGAKTGDDDFDMHVTPPTNIMELDMTRPEIDLAANEEEEEEEEEFHNCISVTIPDVPITAVTKKIRRASKRSTTKPGSDAKPKRTRRAKRTKHVICVPSSAINAKGTLIRSTNGHHSASSSSTTTPSGSGDENKRREILKKQRALTFSPTFEIEWVAPEYKDPIAYDPKRDDERGTSAGASMIYSGSHFAGQDICTGTSIASLVEDGKSRHKTLPVSDWAFRFAPKNKSTIHQRERELLCHVYALQEQAHHTQKTNEDPSLSNTAFVDLFNAINAVHPTIERISNLISPHVDEFGVISQPPLPSVPQVSREYIEEFLRMPNLKEGERPCINGLLCRMRNLSPNNDLKMCSPLTVCTMNNRRGHHTTENTETFIGVEFLLPDVYAKVKETKRFPEKQGMCVICILQLVNFDQFRSLRYTDRSWQALVDKYREVGANPAVLNYLMKNEDRKVLASRLGCGLPFRVCVGPGPSKFPADACLIIKHTSSGGTTVTHETLFMDSIQFKWIKVEGRWSVSMCLPCEYTSAQGFQSSPISNPWGVRQIRPVVETSDRGTYVDAERDPIQCLTSFYRDLAQIEREHEKELTDAASRSAIISGVAAITKEKEFPFAFDTFEHVHGGPTDILKAFVLCSFEDTVIAVRNGDVKPKTPLQYNEVWFPTTMSLSAIDVNHPIDPKKYSILIALLHRVHIAYSEWHRLMGLRRIQSEAAKNDKRPREEDPAIPDPTSSPGLKEFYELLRYTKKKHDHINTVAHMLRAACFHWKLILSCHYRFMEYLWLRPTESLDWEDGMLTRSFDESVMPPYVAYYPDVKQSISVGILPRLTRTVASMGFFIDSPANKHMPILHLLRKVFNVICAVRNWDAIIDEYSKNADGIMELLNMCLLVSSLRMYPDSLECPTMTSAVTLFNKFTSGTKEASYGEWKRTHGTIVWFALREYLSELLGDVDALFFTLAKATNFGAVKKSVSNGLDHAIKIHGLVGAFQIPEINVDTCGTLHDHYYTKEQLKHSQKIKRISFLNMLCMTIDSMFERIYMKNETFCYADCVSPEMCTQMKHYISRLDPFENTIIQLHHLSHWGIDPDLLTDLFVCKDRFELEGESDYRTKKNMEIIFLCSARNFHAIHMFVTFARTHCRMELIPTSKQDAELQERALRLRFHIAPYRNLTTEQITDYVCETCVKLCADVMPNCWTFVKNSDQLQTFGNTEMPRNVGHSGVKWNPDTECLVCRKSVAIKDNSFQACKKLFLKNKDNFLLYKDGANPTLRPISDARDERKIRFRQECHDTPVRPVCLIGACLRIDNNLYTLCAVCGCKMIYSLETCGTQGPTCTAHKDYRFACLAPDNILYSRLGPIPLTSDVEKLPRNLFLATRGYNWDDLKAACSSTDPYYSAFGVQARLEAVLLLRERRATPINMPNLETLPLAIEDKTLTIVKERKGRNVHTLSVGTLQTYAMVGNNLSVKQVRLMDANDIKLKSDVLLAHTERCFFCTHKRPKLDKDWGVTVAQNEAMQYTIVFFCKTHCTSLVPTIATTRKCPLYGTRQLIELYENSKTAVARRRKSDREPLKLAIEDVRPRHSAILDRLPEINKK